ncbi:site-specific DNA-methyltransferase [Anaeromusa acidaminophila]|uniref:site-specific DNA-methyltransferase n=1 Tax=Anaeromusa acidaminophila TaxID=81464 RepID=UPI000371CA17|nr:site-specific DNA-methyltransferase [Anaeromusa acidaminophila]
MQTTERFEKVDIDLLIPYARNARTHSKEQILQLRSSLREFGFVNPIIVDKDLNIIAGHGRVLAAKAEGVTQVPCVFAEHLTDAQKRAYILADNRLALNAGWDEQLLALEFGELKDLGFDLELTGFGLDEIEKLFAADGEDVQDDDFDLTAALEQAAFVLSGDVWTLGRHRLICGDATDADTVKKLMDGRKANLVLTDPPYNVGFESASGLKIKNDSQKSEPFYSFLLAAFRSLADNLESGGSAYIFHADTEGENFRRAFREAGFHLSGTCIWAKDSFVMGRSPYQWQHEPILYGWLKTGTHKWYAGRSEATIWNFAKPQKNSDHPTSKPLDLLAYPIKNSSQANGIVLDTFGGSGSTLIACEQADRICHMLELDEKYASVILRRYAEFKQNGGEDITCERDGEVLRYADLVKEVAGRQ